VLDLTAEAPLSLAAAAKLVPPARTGKKTHLSTLLRWILRGCRGPGGVLVRLEAVRLGNRWMTSREAIQRFTERLTPRLDGDDVPPIQRSESRRRRASERAAAELEQLGL
jgi:hypothetical protein